MAEQIQNKTTQTTEFSADAKDVLQYQDNKVVVKKAPLKGQNVAVYVRPGDDILYDMENIDISSLEYRLVGGDIVVSMPNGGIFTFVSMALMGYSENPPSFFGSNGQKFTLNDVLSGVKEVNDLPFDSIAVEADIQYEDKVKKIIEELEDITRKLTKDASLQQSYNDYMPDIGENGDSKKSTYEDLSTVDKLQEPIPVVIENPFTDYYDESYSRHFTSYIPTGGTVEDAAKPAFYFKTTAHQVPYEEILNNEGQVEILGGGGSINGYLFDSITNQFEAETIDMSQRSEDMIIRAEGSLSLSRVLRFEPQMPEGFYVESFSLSGLPADITILDKDGNAISGSVLTKEQMIFKDALGNIISYDDDDFITKFKSVEFKIEYDDTLASPFNVAITANYKLDDDYTGTTDILSSQSYTNQYTFALKDITSADDYTYVKTDFINGKDEGFILSKEPNINIIKDGSGNSIIYGGLVQDRVYDGAGNDTVYLSAGDDTLYGGSGTNYIYGDADKGDIDAVEYVGEDTLSYETVQSFGSSEVKLLTQSGLLSLQESQKLNGTYEELDGDGNPVVNTLDVDMLAYYKGVYVDLDGVYVEGLNIDVNGDEAIDINDKINVISKFADREEKFTYDEDGNAVSTTLVNSGLENLQPVGYDIVEDIENVTGSSYNDTIYGNILTDNILSGLGGSDILDGRGGNNTLLGGDGYDTLMAGSGNDFIDGGADTDTVSYENYTQGIVIRFDRPNEEEFDYSEIDDGGGSFIIKDTIVNTEDIRGSEFADTIYGNGNTNFIEAGGGDDSIFAGGGYDFIDGGDGNDWISYNPADYPDRAANPNFMEEIQGITVDLNSSDFVMVKETTTNRLLDLVKSVEQIRATNGNDVIYGNNTSSETIWALDGNDRLESRGGNDTLYGGDGDDYIRAGRGVDISYGGADTDYLELYDDALAAGSRNIRLSEAGTIQYSTDTTDGIDGTWNEGYNTNDGVNFAYEFEGFGGSNSADALYGNSQNNVLNGHGGDDTINGFDGADTIRGGDGADTIYGGDGDDIIYGDKNNDIIDAGAGDDTVYGYGMYNGGISNNDTIDGGTGRNTLNYTGTSNGFVLDMTVVDGSGYATADFSTGSIYDDKVKNFTKIIGSTGNDTITANNSGMYLDGWSGTDNLYGGAGDDTVIARNTSGEILDGNGGVDTLELVQNVNLRNITVNNFEILDLQSYNGYLNVSQLSQFQTIKGSGNFYLYGTTGNDSFDFGTIDFSDFSGNMYVYGYAGDDVYNFENATFAADASFYLDANSGTDTLKLGTNQTLNMTDNYYNTFEDFDIGSDSTLNVTALNNNGRSFYAHNKNFDDVDYINDGHINFTGGTGNDTFYVDYTAIRDGKLSIDGIGGADRVDIRTFTENVNFTGSDYNELFSNIETLDIDQASAYSVDLSADVLSTWIDGSNLTLDISNNTQGSHITISDTHNGTDITNLTVGSSYSVTPADDVSLNFTMAVV